jgi:hypothetical protein
MPLYRFCVSTPEGAAEMELGFHEDRAAVAYAQHVSDKAEIVVWRDDVGGPASFPAPGSGHAVHRISKVAADADA